MKRKNNSFKRKRNIDISREKNQTPILQLNCKMCIITFSGLLIRNKLNKGRRPVISIVSSYRALNKWRLLKSF